MSVKVKIETAAGETAYTVTAAAPQQPTSASLALDVDSPVVTVSGLTGGGEVQVWAATDGSDPTAAEDDTGVRMGNGSTKLDLRSGDKVIFRGVNIPS